MTSHSGNPFARRDFIKLVGVGAVTAAGLAAPAPASAFAATRSGAVKDGAQVDFYVGSQSVAFAADGSGRITGKISVTVGNNGPDDATAEAIVRIVSPFYANFDRAAQPAEFSEYLVADPDSDPQPNIPELMECRVPADKLGKGAEHTFDVGLVLLSGGPNLPGDCRIGVTPTSDIETNDLGNLAGAVIGKPASGRPDPPEGANTVNFYFTYAKAVLSAQPTQTRKLPIMVGNVGPHDASEDALFTFVTPFQVKIDRDDPDFAALGPDYKHQLADDPWVPDIVTVPVPKEYLKADEGLLTDIVDLPRLEIPLRWHGSPSPSRAGRGYLAAGSGDFDLEKSIAIGGAEVMLP